MVIVAAVDGSDHESAVVAEASTLAERFGEELHVIFVLEEDEHTDLLEDYSGKRRTLDDVLDDIVDDAVSRAVSDTTVEYETIGRIGEPGDEIVEYARESDARYVVVGGRSRSPVGKALFGSVTQSVLLKSTRPVVTVISSD